MRMIQAELPDAFPVEGMDTSGFRSRLRAPLGGKDFLQADGAGHLPSGGFLRPLFLANGPKGLHGQRTLHGLQPSQVCVCALLTQSDFGHTLAFDLADFPDY